MEQPTQQLETVGFVFKKYSEIENTYREQALENVVAQGLDEGLWIVTEKIHGSNVTFYTDGHDIRVAKRTSFLETEEEQKKFFNIPEIVKRYRPYIIKTFEILKGANPDVKYVRIHGEVFGGTYPHKKVKLDPNAIKVQSGVWYCPTNEFYAFDLHDGVKYLDYTRALEVFKEAGFPHYAEPLLTGTLKEALAYPHEFAPLLPQKLGLPPIEKNQAEGVVIKPNVAKWFRSGERVIFKHKTDAFMEKATKPAGPKIQKPQTQLSTEANDLMEEFTSLITMPRLHNVVSKIGQVTVTDTSAMISAYTKDVMEEFNKDNKEAFSKLKDEEQKVFTKKLGMSASKLVKEFFVQEKL